MATFTDLNLLDCASCRLEISDRYLDTRDPVPCDHCGKKVAVFVFPALLRKASDLPAAAPVIASESSCFYHADKQAAVVCDECGRFLCDLCDVELDGRHLCSPCLESVSTGNDAAAPGTKYYYYDTLALVYAGIGFITMLPAIVLAPLALYTVVRHWNSPRSVLPRSKWRFVVAAVLALLQLAYWVFLLFVLIESN